MPSALSKGEEWNELTVCGWFSGFPGRKVFVYVAERSLGSAAAVHVSVGIHPNESILVRIFTMTSGVTMTGTPVRMISPVLAL